MGTNVADTKPVIEAVATGAAPRGGAAPQTADFDWRTFDPTMLDGGVSAPLATELTTYRDHLDELLPHTGQYVVIKGQSISSGFFSDRKSAIAAAIAEFGPGPVLVKRITVKEPVRRIGHAIL